MIANVHDWRLYFLWIKRDDDGDDNDDHSDDESIWGNDEECIGKVKGSRPITVLNHKSVFLVT